MKVIVFSARPGLGCTGWGDGRDVWAKRDQALDVCRGQPRGEGDRGRGAAARQGRRGAGIGAVVLPAEVQDDVSAGGILGVPVPHEVGGAQVHLDIAGHRRAGGGEEGGLADVRPRAAPGAAGAQQRDRERASEDAGGDPAEQP